MNNEKKIPINYLLNLLYSIFTLIIPLITTPYISAVLLPEGVGKYSFTYSVSNYFCVFAQLGIGLYAQREIAKKQGDKYYQSLLFHEIMVIKFVTASISCTIFSVLCGIHFFRQYNPLMMYWIFNIIAQFFDIAFLFQGNEDFGKVVLRNVIIKVLGILVIFLFVKTQDDVWIYILSNSMCALFGVLVMWTYLPRYIVKIDRKQMKVWRHVKPAVALFVPTIASSLAGYLDRIVMGLMIKGVNNYGVSNADVEIGLYEQTDKIIRLGTSVFTALGAVMLPRNANVASENIYGVKKNIDNSLRFSLMIAIPIMFGLIAVANILVPWFFGDKFAKCITYIRLYAPMEVLLVFENVYGYQYLMAVGCEKKYTFSLTLGVVVNGVLNMLIVPILWGKGAIICTLISELLIVSMLIFYSRKIISMKEFVINNMKYAIAGMIMFLVLSVFSYNVEPTMLNTIIFVAFGALIYFILLVVFKDKFIFILLNNIKNKFNIGV